MSNQADLGQLAREEVEKPQDVATHDGVANATAHIVGAVTAGTLPATLSCVPHAFCEGAPVDAHASGGKPDEVAAAVAEARAAGEAQRDDEDMDAVRGELDEAGESHTHLSASKERRLAARAKRDAADGRAETAA